MNSFLFLASVMGVRGVRTKSPLRLGVVGARMMSSQQNCPLS